MPNVYMNEVPRVQTVGADGIGVYPPVPTEKVDKRSAAGVEMKEVQSPAGRIPNPQTVADGSAMVEQNDAWSGGANLPNPATATDGMVIAVENGKYVVADASVQTDVDQLVAQPYSPSSLYNKDDYAVYENQLYRCKQDINPSEEFNPAHWDATDALAEIAGKADVTAVEASMASEYSSKTYKAGEYCYHGGTLYRCKSDIDTAEAWTAAHWEAAKLADDTSALKTAAEQINKIINTPDELVDISFWQGAESKGLLYASGELVDKSSTDVTNYIDVSSYSRLYYKNINITSSSSSNGMAFYDKEKNYITGHAYCPGASAQGYGDILSVVAVPENAVYARFAYFKDTTTYGYFKLYGVLNISEAIDPKKLQRKRVYYGSKAYLETGFLGVSNGKAAPAQADSTLKSTAFLRGCFNGYVEVELDNNLCVYVFKYSGPTGGEYLQQCLYNAPNKSKFYMERGACYKIVVRTIDRTGVTLSDITDDSVVFYAITTSTKMGKTNKFEHFSVSVNINWPAEDDGDTNNHELNNSSDILGVLTLPQKTYTLDGPPVPVIMYCHGASCRITEDSWYGNTSNFLDLIEQFLSSGYAVFDVNNTRDMSGGFPDWGSLPLMSAYIRAWGYIKENYNVEDSLYIFSSSMGTATALNMMKWYGSRINAAAMTAPRPMGCALRSTTQTDYDSIIKYYVAWGLASDEAMEAEDYALTSYAVGDYCLHDGVLQRCTTAIATSEAWDSDHWYTYSTDLFSADKFKGFGQYEDLIEIGDSKYTMQNYPPCKVLVGTADTAFLTETRAFYKSMQNAGNYVNYRELTDKDHDYMTFLNGDNSLKIEVMNWFRRFNPNNL